jgi:RNA polymerase sigma-70 factor (ECF subfamily)
VQDAAVGDDRVRDSLRLTYESIHARLWRAVLAFSGSREVADEAVAEAFAQALARGAAVRDPEAWIWRAAFAIARGELGRGRHGPPPVPAAAEAEPMPELALDLLAALATLSETDRQIVVLRHVGGYSAPEIARITASTGGAVRVRLHRALAALRRELGGEP